MELYGKKRRYHKCDIAFCIHGILGLISKIVEVTLDVDDRSTLITGTACKVTERTD